jgi:uncharacterized protein (DUF924 family)
MQSPQDIEIIDDILKFWFGRVEDTVLPSKERSRIWFAESTEVDKTIKARFADTLEKAIQGQYQQWHKTPRGQLASIILLEQFSRHIYRNTPQAYAQDKAALGICIEGLKNEFDHDLSLIERVFFYFPLLHSENISDQEQSVNAYQMLSELAFSETRVIYDSFLKFAHHHYSVIESFGRFPQRNDQLKRTSSQEEMDYLKEINDENNQP